MYRLVLDANVLFSVAYKENTGISKLWALKNIKLITSEYALEKAKQNLSNLIQLHRLETFSQKIEVHKEEDRPMLAVTIAAKADYLITGDF